LADHPPRSRAAEGCRCGATPPIGGGRGLAAGRERQRRRHAIEGRSLGSDPTLRRRSRSSLGRQRRWFWNSRVTPGNPAPVSSGPGIPGQVLAFGPTGLHPSLIPPILEGWFRAVVRRAFAYRPAGQSWIAGLEPEGEAVGCRTGPAGHRRAANRVGDAVLHWSRRAICRRSSAPSAGAAIRGREAVPPDPHD
jgi:hypothetical protein